MNYPVFIYDRGACAIRDNTETQERERIMAIVQNTITDLYLIVQYTSNGEIAFVSGGIEDGDSKEETILKELKEETGITDIKTISLLEDWFFEVRFCSPHRNKNYHNKTHVYYVTTEDQDFSINDEEKVIQNPHRWTIEQIQQKIDDGRNNTNYESMQYLVDKLKLYKL